MAMVIMLPMVLIVFLFITYALVAGVGVVAGYVLGRRAGRRERQEGFPVLPPDPMP
jgi:hypothetical protein